MLSSWTAAVCPSPTPADRRYLELHDLDFVAVVTGRTYNSKGIQFEWTQSRHRPDYSVFYDTARRKPV